MPSELSELPVPLDKELDENIVLIWVLLYPNCVFDSLIVDNWVDRPVYRVVAGSFRGTITIGDQIACSIPLEIDRVEWWIVICRAQA